MTKEAYLSSLVPRMYKSEFDDKAAEILAQHCPEALEKEKSTEKIDGAIATIMALDRAIRCGNDNGASVYDDRGILFI